MRSTRDRIRHAILFEVFGLALIIPLGTVLFDLHTSDMGVIGFGSALVAMAWNYVYNLGFDRAPMEGPASRFGRAGPHARRQSPRQPPTPHRSPATRMSR